jgi:cytosine/adenosine deaminase-related metal-dependent hydrolase
MTRPTRKHDLVAHELTSDVVEVDCLAGGPDGLERPAGHSAWAVHIDEGVITGLVPTAPQPGRLRLLAPTLVNAHDHGRGNGTQLLGVRDAPLDEWIAAFTSATPSDVQYEQCLVALSQMRDGGIGAVSVCINPTTPEFDEEVRLAVAATRAVGIRAAIAVPIFTVPRGTYRQDRSTSERSRRTAIDELDRIDRLADELDGSDVSFAYHPVGPQWVDEDVLQACAERSDATGRVVHMHLLETYRQREWADRTYPDGLIMALDQIGLLTPRLVLAHGVHLRPDEIGLLARRGCSIAINVSSNFRLSSGLAPVNQIGRSQARLAVGLDGMALDDDLDMWRELRLVRGLWQGQRLASVAAGEVLTAATTGGSAALGAAATQPVQIGNRADFVVHDLSHWATVARESDWTATEILLAGAQRRSVVDVWCDGARVGPVD